MRWRALTAAAVAVSGTFLVPSAAADAAEPCEVTYTVVNQWSTGFQAEVSITNNDAPIDGWTLAFTFPGTQRVNNGWNGGWTQTGTRVTVDDADWNAVIGTGQTLTGIGFVGDLNGPNPDPTAFTLNGVACDGAAQVPTVSLTSPANNSSFVAPATVELAATASEPDQTITRVDFLANGEVVGSDTTSPYAFTWSDVAAGGYTLTARATDSAGASADSVPVTILVRQDGAGTGPPEVHVSGNRLVDQNGDPVILRGVNRSGTEYQCVHGFGVFDGPVDDTATAAITTWNANVVRVPLNEDCWLGLPNVDPRFAGANYRSAIEEYVNRLHDHGLAAIVELHWSDGTYTGGSSQCGQATADCLKPMPDAEHAIDFWSSVAARFAGDHAVLFDLFNEPFPDRATSDIDAAWACWRDGGNCPGISFPVAGMRDLVDAVRGTGADNVILLGGLAFSNDMTRWLEFAPDDPLGNLVAAFHSYNFNICVDLTCWNREIAPVADEVPLVMGEIGENDCGHGYIDGLMDFADQHAIGYLGWAWNANFDCASGPALISSYDGTPTPFGVGLRDRLLGLG